MKLRPTNNSNCTPGRASERLEIPTSKTSGFGHSVEQPISGGGWCRPFQPVDFQTRQWFPHSGWPIELDALDPYYRRAVETLDLGAHEWDAHEIASRHDLDLLPFDDDPTVRSVLYQFSAPTRFGKKYQKAVENASNIDVYLHANLVNIRAAPNGETIEQLDCKTLGGTEFSARAQEYVLAMGGIENPRLLLASNGVTPEGIGNEHDQVGRYFMEHPRFFGTPGIVVASPDISIDAYLSKNRCTLRDDDRPEGRSVETRLALEVPPQIRSERQLLGMTATFSEIDRRRDEKNSYPRKIADVVGLDIDHSYRLFRMGLRTEQRPLPDSRVTLMNQRDSLGVPRPKLQWRHSSDHLESIFRTLRTLAAGFGRLGQARVWLRTDDQGHFDHPFEGSHHHMGTTRMSTNPERGVVDRNCRVHGIDNLYVAGCSVFPTGGYNNPTFTLVALAHRLADHLETVSQRR